MSRRIPGSERTREGLRDLIEGRLSSEAGRSDLVRLATRLIIEEGLEAEVCDILGRDYYEHGGEAGQGYRNGVREGRLKTAEGFIGYSIPQVAGTCEPFCSELRGHLKGRSEALEDLAIEMLARGLSVRDIEDAFKDETGRLLLSRTAVSELGERLWADYQDFATRDLGDYDIIYLFIDGIAERIRPGPKREPVLAAWGFTVEGRKVLLRLMAGSKEDAETVNAFFQDMRARGLATGVAAEYEADYPSAVACFMDDFEACIAHLRLPIAHRRATRTTNLLARIIHEGFSAPGFGRPFWWRGRRGFGL